MVLRYNANYRLAITDSVTVKTGRGGAQVNVLAAGVPTEIDTGGGTNTVWVGSAGPAARGTVKTVTAPLTVNGQTGTNSLTLDDYNGASSDVVTITPNQVGAASGDTFFGSGGRLTYSGVGMVTVNTANNSTGDTINVTPSTTTAFVVNGGPLVNSTLTLYLPPGVTQHPTSTGPGSGYFTFTPSTYQRIDYTGIRTINVRTGPPPAAPAAPAPAAALTTLAAAAAAPAGGAGQQPDGAAEQPQSPTPEAVAALAVSDALPADLVRGLARDRNASSVAAADDLFWSDGWDTLLPAGLEGW